MRIGLVALSGIRVQDARLLRLGLTLPGFVERSKTIASLPSLGLLTLAGMTPERHALSYHEVRDLAGADAIPPDLDLVALSTFSAQAGEAYALARRFRERGVPVVIGGSHVSALPDEALAHCDAVVCGEGELSWSELLADAETGRLRSLYTANGLTFDLARAPMPRFDLLDVERYNRITIQTSRGCPHRCEFCASSVLLGPGYRQKPVGRVLEEIDSVRAIWPRPFVEFADDDAIVDRPRWRDLLEGLAERDVRWFAETDISIADDGDLLDRMRRAGCREVLIGLESPVAADLAGIEQRSDWKHRQAGRYVEAVRTIQAHGIRVAACFVVGLDGQGPEIFDAILDFVRRAEPFDVQLTILTPFPGTPLLERLRREGRMRDDGHWERCTLFDLMFRPRGMSPEVLVGGFERLAATLYADQATLSRRRAFRCALRAAGGGGCPETIGS